MGRNYIRGWLCRDGFSVKNLSYEELLSRIHEIVCSDFNSFVYVMTALCNISCKIARFKIKNDRDVQFILGQAVDKPKVYVTILPSQQHLQQPIQLPIQ